MRIRVLLLVLFTLSTSACADLEMPRNAGGNAADEMKLSPCACDPIDYNSEGFQWLG
ncbi:hypothetical protein [Rhodospirillum sp. A1_3_36]|uniref:hypothetical protein n=1 Tax=Rhodospirillum sp. A1_3_36 TaxID=3391666 RepID=UPI0039A40C22